MKHIIELDLVSGAPFTHSESHAIPDRSKKPRRLPENCVAYRYYDIDKDGHRANVSGTHFIGMRLSMADIKKLRSFKAKQTYANMKNNNIAFVVRTSGEHYFEFKKGDTV